MLGGQLKLGKEVPLRQNKAGRAWGLGLSGAIPSEFWARNQNGFQTGPTQARQTGHLENKKGWNLVGIRFIGLSRDTLAHYGLMLASLGANPL